MKANLLVKTFIVFLSMTGINHAMYANTIAKHKECNDETSLENSPLIITGIVAKSNELLGAIELYVASDIPDLSIYSIGVDNDHDGSDGAEYYLSGSATAGDFLYLAEYPTAFQSFFGFAPDFDMGGTNALLPSGNDAVELFIDINNVPTLVDGYGTVGQSGNGTAWEYNNSWAYRKTGTGPDGGFVIENWRIPGPNIISSESITNGNAPVPFPTGTYGQPYDEVPPIAVCQDITFEIDQGNFTVDANLINNGSSDDVGITFMELDDSSYFCSDAGDNLVTLTVYDAAGNKDTCTATINIIPAAPQIICQDITVDLGFNGQTTVTFYDITNGISGACIGEGTEFYVSPTNPSDGTSGLFDGETTINSPTDDVFADGNAVHYQEFSFTVPVDGNYLPNFNFSSSTTDDLLFAFISDQPVTPNVGAAPNRTGFLNGFVYQAPANYLGSFDGDDEVALTAGTTYYMQVAIINQSDSSLLSTATYTGGFGGTSQNLDEYTYTTADLGNNTLYAYFTDDLGRMTSCAATVTVVNAAPFITTWKTNNPGTSNDNQITLPTTGGGYSFDVDWGDGNFDYGVGSSNIVHSYTTPGTYTVRITGDFPRMNFNGGGDAEKLLTIEQWGNIEWSSMDSAFEGCSNLNITNPAIDTPDLSNVTNMQDMFYDCTSFNGDVTNWDVSNVQDFNEMFGYCEVFNQPIENWNMSSATDLSYMFYEALAFNQPLNNWNTSNVLLMEGVFSETESFNQELNNWNVSNVTSMYEMFDAAEAFNGNISSWNVSNVEDMRDLFDGAFTFNQDISGWNVSSVTTMENMFDGADVFNQDISNWNVSAVTDMESMFNGANAFNQDIGNWNVSNVTNMSDMFRGADVFDQNLGNWDLSNIIDTGSSSSGLRNMFGAGPSGISLSRPNYDNTLIGWNTDSSGIPNDGIDDIPQNIIFGGGKSNYCDSEVQRQNLIDTHSWSINDQGKACLTFRVSVYLQGATLNDGGGSLNEMRDDLRVAGLLPTTSPYPDALTCDPTIFTDFDDEEAAVDWIWMELRDATDNTNIVFSRSFLLDRLGNIYDNTLGAIELSVPDGDYYVVVKHRNHLGIMSATPMSLSATNITTVDFTDGSTPTYGTNAQTTFGMPTGIMGMWTGNVNGDAVVQYSGTNPDTPDMLSTVLNDAGNFLNFPTYIVNGYNNYDVNMDGGTQYSGTNPDTPILLQNILAHPGNFLNFSTYPIMEQLPEND